MDLVRSIYRLTKSFPGDEKYGIISQLRRAAVSVSNNLAEGNSRMGRKNQANFVQMSYSSTMEVLNRLIISKDLEHLKTEKYQGLRELVNEIANKLTALHQSKMQSHPS